MSHVAYESELCSVVSAGIKFRQCSLLRKHTKPNHQYLYPSREDYTLEKVLRFRHLIPAPVDLASACAWLYKHPRIACQKAKSINDPRSLLIKATFSCEVIHASMPRELVGNQAWGRVLCLGCPCI